MITKKDYEEMIEEFLSEFKNRYVEDCLENECKMTISKMTGELENPEKKTH